MAVVGAPSYFAQRSKPRHPRDLVEHDCLNWHATAQMVPYRWEFTEGGREIAVAVPARVLSTDSTIRIRLARAGMKRFYPESDVAVIGVDDPEYERFLELLDAQGNFIERLQIGQGLRAYVFYPRGWLLRRDPTQPMTTDDTLVIAEEEVPRIGASLKRKFQYARSSDGRSWLWIGRSKIAGRGEAASELRFDVAIKKATLR